MDSCRIGLGAIRVVCAMAPIMAALRWTMGSQSTARHGIRPSSGATYFEFLMEKHAAFRI